MYQMYVWNNRIETCAVKINMYFCVNCDCFVNIHVIMKLATNRIMQRSHLKTLCFCVIWYNMRANYNYHRLFFPVATHGHLPSRDEMKVSNLQIKHS
jgi:hypothetical protein